MLASAVRFEGAAPTFLIRRSIDIGNTQKSNAHNETIYSKQDMRRCTVQ